MKINKLFAILFAVLGVNTLSAQTDVTSTYLTNADFSSTDGWTANVSSGTYRDYGNLLIGGKLASYTASTVDATHLNSEYCFGLQCRWSTNYASYNQETSQELPAGVYTLSFDVENVNGSTTAAAYNNLFYVKVGDNTYTDTYTEWMKGKSSWTTHSITFVITEPTKATISLGYGTGSNNIGTSNTPVLYVSHLKLTHRNIDDISAENPADLTSYIVNNSFETGNSNGWTYKGSSDTGVKANSNGTYTTTGVDGNYLYNTWWQGTPLTQTVANLPNGIYQLNVLVASGDGDGSTPDIYLLANGEHSEVYTITDGNNKVFHDVSYEFKVLNGQATIGIVGGNDDGTYNAEGHWWYKADNFRLTYKGIDLSLVREAYETALANATAARDNNEYASIVGIEKTNLLNAIALQPGDTKSELETATTALLNATTAFTAAKSDYDALATEKTIAAGLGMSDEAIATATAATKTGLVALQDLKVAEYNYIQQTYTETATLGSWTEDFKDDLDGEGYKVSGPKYMDEWSGSNVTRTAKQTITLPAGNYALSVIARGQAGASGQLYYKIGETTTNVALIMKGNRGRGVDVDGVANFSDEATYNCNGEGFGWEYRFITFQLNEETAVEIGASITIQGQWASIYAPVLLTTEASIKNLRLTEITNLLSEVPTGKMDATVQSTLDSKKAAAEAASLETEIEELTIITTELNEAIAAAKASIADYELIAGYIAKANKIDESIAAEYQTAYNNGTLSDAETVFQNLEVATYNYVIGEFTYNVELEAGGWVPEGPVGSKAEQHYSGNSSSYMEQSDAAWGSSSWNISYKYEKTLPAGKYIFKVAGRRAQGTGNTMSLNVTNITDSENPVELGSVNDFPEGDVGLGINKAGAASFNAEDEAGFANNNAGRGWQWRYVMFELDAETTVEVAVNAAATTNHQWISFCDATLQMTEETYLNANKGALDAPTAAAEALVNTKPMGDAENEALKTALALSVTTGAELQAKIDALNVAVTNANAWVAAYNEAQAPLVAALERFETDYNDGEEGAIDYMAQSRWATVIEMVEAAALAKDVTNSYEGFAAATTNLVAALDAADGSIAEYKALKEAIDNANAAAAVNWGDQPFQRPEEDKEDLTNAINAAQTVYDAATADGEGVTSQTTALNDALDVVNNLELNAPAEGAVYNIVVATEGHSHLGNPVVASLDVSKADGSDANNLTGYGFAAKEAYTDGPANMLYTFTKVKDNNYHISVKVKGETVYLTYGSLNGSAAGWKESQIQGTTNIETAGEFEIVASNTTEGVIKIRNTVTNDFIDSQDGGNIYTDTGIENEDFKLTLVKELSAEISIDAADKFATCVLMFDADLANTEGLKVYVPESYTTQDGLNYFIFKAFEEAVLPAYTPCILYAANGFEGTLTGIVQMEDYDDQVVKGSGYLYGALESQNITEGYVMVKLEGEDEVTFRNVSSSGKDITIPAGKCWLQVPAAQASVASFTCLFRGGEASNIDEVLLDKISVKDGAIYTLDGKRVNDIERGKIYIINGKKAIVK